MDKFLEFKVNKNRVPVEVFWDLYDPRLLAVETEFAKEKDTGADMNDTVVVGTPSKTSVPIN